MSTLAEANQDLFHGARIDDEANWRMDRLRGAQEDVYRLLSYATEQGRTIDPAVLQSAVDIVRIKPARMTEAEEQILWGIRATLSQFVSPAQSSGLRLLEILQRETADGESRTLRVWSGTWLMAAIVIVAAVHTYALLGGRLVEDGELKLVQAGGLSQRLKDQKAEVRVSSARPAGAVGGAAAAAYAPDGTPIAAEAPLTVGNAAGMTENMHSALDRQRELLEIWNVPWRVLVLPVSISKAQAQPAPSTSRDLAPPPESATPTRVVQWMHDLAQDLDKTGTMPLDAERYSADLARRVLMEYLLPMLYGALGAFLFVVRTVTGDIDRGSIRLLLSIRYRTRLLLGAVFGLAVAMLTSEQAPFMKTIPLSAVALSFMAGYGVEVAFGLLDALIDRFRKMSESLSTQGAKG